MKLFRVSWLLLGDGAEWGWGKGRESQGLEVSGKRLMWAFSAEGRFGLNSRFTAFR